ncbi:MAG: TIGR02444 family protein [Pseudomonadota bacterium]
MSDDPSAAPPREPERAEDARLGEAFWRFSLALYAQPGAAERCLSLQDRAGWDVNLVLWALWAGLRRGAPSPEAVRSAASLSAQWREDVVAPLRRIRRTLKIRLAKAEGRASADAERLDAGLFRESVKVLELQAEERQQRAIAAFAAEAEPPVGPATARRLFEALRLSRDRAAVGAEQEAAQEAAKEEEDWSALLTIAQQIDPALGRALDAAPQRS